MNKKILNLAIPNIISNVTVPLLGLVDLALMGHLEHSYYIDAIALGGMIFNIIYWSFGFLRMGTAGFTSQSYGKRDLHEASLLLARALLIGVGVGLVFIILQKGIGWLSFSLLRGEKHIEDLASNYFYIRIWAAPATLGLYALYGWYIGMQNARIPMIIAVTINILNIIFNYLFVYQFNMNSSGVALGTLISQYLGFFLGLFFLKKYYGRLFRYWKLKLILQADKLKKFMMVNKDIFIRTICLIIVFSFFTARSAYSDTMSNEQKNVLAVNVLLQQFFMIYSYLIDGFAYAAESLTGRYVGAREPKLLKKVIKKLFYWGIGIGLTFTFVYLFGGKYILRLLTDNKDVIANAAPYMFWIVLIPLVTFPAFLWDGIYVGATASATMRNSMIISTFLFFFPVYYGLKDIIGNHALWMAFMVYMLARGVSLWFFANKAIYKPAIIQSR